MFCFKVPGFVVRSVLIKCIVLLFPLCRADVSVPLDVQLVFGFPHHPINTQRFTSSDRRLSLAMMTYISSFIQTGSDQLFLTSCDTTCCCDKTDIHICCLMAGTQTHPFCGQSQFCPTGHRLCLLMHHLPTWNWAPPSNTIRVWVRTPVPFGTNWEADWPVRAVSPHHASLHLTWRAGFDSCFPLWLFSRKCWGPISELMIPLLFFQVSQSLFSLYWSQSFHWLHHPTNHKPRKMPTAELWHHHYDITVCCYMIYLILNQWSLVSHQ